MSVTLQVRGIRTAIAALQTLGKRVGIKHLRIAANAYGGIVKRAAERNAPVDQGLLAKSERVKVKIPDASYNAKHHGKPAYIIIGPGRGIVGMKSKRGRISAKTLAAATKALAKRGGRILSKRASRYAHLVEKKTHFLARAASSSAPQAFQAFSAKINSGIEQECGALLAQQTAKAFADL